MADPMKRILAVRGRVPSESILGGLSFDGHLATVFSKIPVTDFPPPAKDGIITVNSDMDLAAAVEVLSTNHILCAPVVDMSCTKDDATWREKYVGMLDMSDVVLFVVNMVKKRGHHGDVTDFRHALAHKAAFHMTRCGDVAHKQPNGDPFLTLDATAGASLLDVTRALTKHHRVVITKGDSGELVNMITQSAVVKMLANHAKNTKEMGLLANKSLRELGLGLPKDVYCAKVTDEAVTAFQVMKDRHVSAVPIVDNDGKLVGNVSNRDVRILVDSPAVYKQMHSPLHHFIAEVKGCIVDRDDGAKSDEEDRGAAPSSGDESDMSSDMAPGITCRSTDSLRVVLRRLHVTKIHRLYIVDDDEKPVSLVALGDILDVVGADVDGDDAPSGAGASDGAGAGAGAGEGKDAGDSKMVDSDKGSKDDA